MKHFFGQAQDKLGNAIAGCTVAVRIANVVPATGALATLYSDNGITTTANPLTSDSLGRFNCYVADGVYDITYNGLSITTYTEASVEMFDLAPLATGEATPGQQITVKSDGSAAAWQSKPVFDIRDYGSMAACYAALPTTGGTCVVPSLNPPYSETFSADLIMSKPNSGFDFYGPATITLGGFRILFPAGITGDFIDGKTVAGGPAAGSSALKLIYTGMGAAIKFADVASTSGSHYPRLSNLWVDITGAGTNAVGIQGFGLGQAAFRDLFIQCAAGANSQVGMQVNDGAGGAFSGAIHSNGLYINSCNRSLQLNDNTVESTFTHNSFLSNGTAGRIGLDIGGNAKSNVCTGGTISGQDIAINFRDSAQHNLVTVETDAVTTADVKCGASTLANEVTRMASTPAYLPIIVGCGPTNLVKSPGGIIFSGGDSLYSIGAGSPVTGTGAPQVLATYTIPAKTLAPGAGFRIKAYWYHTSGTASATYQVTINGTAFVNEASTGVDNSEFEGVELEVKNEVGSLAAQHSLSIVSFRTANVTNVHTNKIVRRAFATTLDFSGALVINMTSNVANTDQTQMEHFSVERKQ